MNFLFILIIGVLLLIAAGVNIPNAVIHAVSTGGQSIPNGAVDTLKSPVNMSLGILLLLVVIIMLAVK